MFSPSSKRLLAFLLLAIYCFFGKCFKYVLNFHNYPNQLLLKITKLITPVIFTIRNEYGSTMRSLSAELSDKI